MQRVVQQAQHQTQLSTLPFASYRPGAAGRNPWDKVVNTDGQTWYRTQVQEL